MNVRNKIHAVLAKIYHSIIVPYKGVHRGKNVEIRPGCFFDRPEYVFIDDNSFVNRFCQFHLGYGTENYSIRIGKNTYLGPNVSMICVSHEIGNASQRAGRNTYSSISVGDGVWIGANSTILPGVSIGDGAIIASGAVVCKSVPPNELWGGVPAHLIKTLN